MPRNISGDEERIFDGARRLKDPAQRRIYLEASCRDDLELRDRIESLLESESQADALFSEGAAAITQTTLLLSAAQQAGDRIGRYRLLQQIGEGGAGLVYMAEQEEPVHRRVALKVIKLGMDTKNVVARFEAERQALALMDHPNIAKVFDGGATHTGRPFFVMELVRGLKITDYCDEHRLSTRERLELFIKVCQAVQHAHQKGIIHRDLKPSNILVTINDGEAVPKVIDFGIAKAIQGRLTDQTLFTAFEQLLGTPAYMSPEQALMTSVDIDTRSDIYSLGVLLYELLTGKTPFDTQELLASGLDELRKTIREHEPLRPSTRLQGMPRVDLTRTAERRRSDVPKLIHGLRGDLDWIVMKCLEKDRARRYETTNGLAQDIAHYLENRPVTARPPSTLYSFRSCVRRNRVAFGAGALLLLAALLITIISVRSALQARHAERIQEGLRAEAIASANVAKAAGAELTEKLWLSYLAQAQFGRFSRKPGARFRGLELVRQAAEIRPSLELRNEAVACMALPDIQLARTIEAEPGLEGMISFDARAERYAIGDEKGAVRVVSVKGNRDVTHLSGTGLVQGIEFSPDASLLAVAYNRSNRVALCVWDIQKRRIKFEPPVPSFRTLAFNHSGLLAVAAINGPLRIFDLESGDALHSFDQGDLVQSLSFHPNGRFLAVADQQPEVRILDISTGRTVAKLLHPEQVFSICWNADGSLLVSGCRDGQIRVWDMAHYAVRSTLTGHQSAVVQVHLNRDDDLLISISWDGTMRLWSAITGAEICSQSQYAWGARFGPDENSILCRGQSPSTVHVDNSELAVFDLNPGRERRLLYYEDKGASEVWGCVFSSDGKFLFSAHRSGLSVWDVEEGKKIAFQGIPGSDGGHGSVYLDPEGQFLIVDGMQTSNLLPVSFEGGQTRTVRFGPAMPLHWQRTADLVSAGEGKYVLAIHHGQAVIADAGTQKEISRFATNLPIEFGAVSPDAKSAVVGNWKSSHLAVFAAQSGAATTNLAAPRMTVARFSADGRWLAAGGYDEYRVWDTRTWQQMYAIRRESTSYKRGVLAFSPDSSTLAIAFTSDLVRLINPADGRQLVTLETNHPRNISALSFSPDGQTLAVFRWNHVAELWDLPRIRTQLAAMSLDW